MSDSSPKLKPVPHTHSPSSISTAKQCRRAWWLRYREGLKPPELTWAQVKRMPVPDDSDGRREYYSARSKALGKEVHRLAEIYLAVHPKRVARARRGHAHYIDWNDLPGQCLAELVRHLPPAGSVRRADLERRVTVTVGKGKRAVRFQGLIDLVGAAAQGVVDNADHKTSGDIRTYALLPDAVAYAIGEPKRSLKDDLQACVYVLARAKQLEPPADGGLCRWNYTETKRSRRSLPVIQYVPTAHAQRVVERAAEVAREVAAYETIDDATPDTTACDDYGGCWFRSEGHCKVKRKWGAVFKKREREKREEDERKAKRMGKPLTLNNIRKDTEKANAKALEEAEAAKRKAAVEAEDDDAPESEAAPESEEAPPSEAPRAASKRKPRKDDHDGETPAPDSDDEDAPDSDDEDAPDSDDEDAPDSEPVPAKNRRASKRTPVPAPAPAPSPRAAAKEAFDAATSPTAAPDHILQFFAPDAFAKGEPRIIASGFAELASAVSELPRNPERAQALRKLIEARDCAVRACTGEDA